MLVTLLIALREGLEAALIVGIMLGYLKKTGQTAHGRQIWIGVIGAIALSLALAVGIQLAGAELEGAAEEIFEGTAMILAVVVLTWMVVWMRTQARTMKSSLENQLQTAIGGGAGWGLAAVAFLAVFREGVETALLLSAAAFTTDAVGALTGAAIGLALAAVLGALIYASTIRLNLRLFFSITSLLLLAFAAGLLARGVHEFQEAGVLATVNEHVWDLSGILSEDSAVGQVASIVFGYQASPSIESVVVYAAYWLATLFGVRWWIDRRLARQGQRAALATGS